MSGQNISTLVEIEDLENFGTLKANELLYDPNIISTKEEISKLIKNIGGNGVKDVKKGKELTDEALFNQALKILTHNLNPRRKNPALIGEFNGNYYKNAKELLKAAQDFFSKYYEGSYEMIFEHLYTKNEIVIGNPIFSKPVMHIMKNKYLESYEAGDSRIELSDRKVNDSKIIKKGFHIGDRVYNWHKKEMCTIINASNQTFGLREGNKTIKVQYDDGTTDYVVPWGLKKDTD